jgi:lipid A ethanolaminephosphotransferase
LLDIETDVYRSALDAFAGCRLPDTFVAQQAGMR